MGETSIEVTIDTFWNNEVLHQNTAANVKDTNMVVYQKACELAGKIAAFESKREMYRFLYPSLYYNKLNYLIY